jgi:hypothetical protein
MRKNLTFIFLWLTFMISAQSNQGTINVNVEDGCGNTFTAPFAIDLYQIIGNTANKLSSSTDNPAQFTNLDPGYTYEVRMSSQDVSDTDISIKDVYVMRQVILGSINNLRYTPTLIASDLNNNFSISTLDQVLFIRNLINITKPSPDFTGWFFMNQKELDANDVTLKNRTRINGIPNGTINITFNGYQYGAVESTVKQFCGPCTEDSTSVSTIMIPDMDVTAGKEVKFFVNYVRKSNDIGLSFSLKYKDGVVSSLKPESNVLTYWIDSTKNINVVTLFEASNPSNGNLYQIAFTPTKSGKLSSFFAINDLYKNEFVYKDGNCLKTAQKVLLSNAVSCPITWPSDITISSCTANIYAGSPSTSPECSNDIAFTYTDQIIGNPCEKILRTWTSVNWFTGNLSTHTQIITIDPNIQLTCVGNASALIATFGYVEVWAIDLIKINNPNNIYSFSPTDPTQKSKRFYEAGIFDINIYDLTENSFCTVKLTIISNGCNDPININPEVTVKENGGLYTVDSKLFDGGNQNHCRGTITEFQIKELSSPSYGIAIVYDFNNNKGKTVSLNLRYKVNGVWENYNGVVKVLLESNLPPFELSCYDDPVTQNVLHEIAFFSPSFDNIYALQAAIRLQDAIMVKTEKKSLKDISFNEELRSLRFLWFSQNVQPLTLSGSDTLFTMTIRPTKSGNLSDIISIAEDIMRSEAILNNLDGTKIDLVFKFLRRPTATQDLNNDIMSVFPNPSNTGQFFVDAPNFDRADITVYDQNGHALSPIFTENNQGKFAITLPENAPNGLYILKAQNDQRLAIKKIVLLR